MIAIVSRKKIKVAFAVSFHESLILNEHIINEIYDPPANRDSTNKPSFALIFALNFLIITYLE
jgi:hypothetical protein